jgi:hypothetical protein
MEGTVLRVPCIASTRRSGFWQSSVRGPGPPAANWTRFVDRRRRASGDCLPEDSTVVPCWQRLDPFALRVAHPSARTRCESSVANCSTGVRGEAMPPVGNAREASAPIPLSSAGLPVIALNDNSGHWDV